MTVNSFFFAFSAFARIFASLYANMWLSEGEFGLQKNRRKKIKQKSSSILNLWKLINSIKVDFSKAIKFFPKFLPWFSLCSINQHFATLLN